MFLFTVIPFENEIRLSFHKNSEIIVVNRIGQILIRPAALPIQVQTTSLAYPSIKFSLVGVKMRKIFLSCQRKMLSYSRGGCRRFRWKGPWNEQAILKCSKNK